MATNISYVSKHKSNFFDTFLNDLQAVYQKRLILRVKECFSSVFGKECLNSYYYPDHDS